MKPSHSVKRVLRTTATIGAAGLLLVGGVTACADDNSSDSAGSAGSTSALPSNAATGDPVKIGFITPEGGPITVPMVREGGEAATQYLNNNGGGLGGHKIDLVVCKEQEDPASATSCANQMVEQKVAAVVAPFGSQGAVMLPIVAGAGIPYVAQAPVSQVEMMTSGAFMLSGGIVAVFAGQAATAAKEGVKKIAVVISDAGDAAASVKAIGTPIFKQAGVDMDVITIPASAADPTPQITAGLAGKPGAVTVLGETSQCISTIKALQTAAPTVKKYLIASCLDKQVIDGVGADAVAGAKAFTTVKLDSDDPSSELYRSVMATYASDVDPAGLAYLGYQVMMSLGEVGKSLTGPVTPKDVMAAFTAAKDVPLPAAPGLSFTCDGSAVPQLKTLCSKSILVSDVSADTKLENTVAVNN
ncbi:ABC transporter substrate-binding protein [Gordonia sp. DT218]|uniref:ABC transporter substrate-binding protein n=1 Tax=unclassified Gordonia (in: high G+C Gram-positive bacteria) TaxID=2657482 RepID=UPI003CF87800